MNKFIVFTASSSLLLLLVALPAHAAAPGCYTSWAYAGTPCVSAGDDATCYYNYYYNGWNGYRPGPTLRFTGIPQFCCISMESRGQAICPPLDSQMQLGVTVAGTDTYGNPARTTAPADTCDGDRTNQYTCASTDEKQCTDIYRTCGIDVLGGYFCRSLQRGITCVSSIAPVENGVVKLMEGDNFTIGWNLINADSNPSAQCALSGNAPYQGGGGYRVQGSGSSQSSIFGPTFGGSASFSNVAAGLYEFNFACTGILDNSISAGRGTITKTVKVAVGGVPAAPVVHPLEMNKNGHGFDLNWDKVTSILPITYEITRINQQTGAVVNASTTATKLVDNVIQDPTDLISYTVVAVNDLGRSAGVTVDNSQLGGVKKTTISTISGAGFSSGTKIYLLKSGVGQTCPANPFSATPTCIQCNNFQLVDSHTIKNVQCDITKADTGSYDVKLINPDGQMAVLPSAFSVSYLQPENVVVSTSGDVSDGTLKISSVSGSNLFSGGIIKVSGPGLVPVLCPFFNYNYDTQKFSDITCDISGLLKQSGGPGSLILTAANDAKSEEVPVVNPFGQNIILFCNSQTPAYSPDASGYCVGSTFTQTNICSQGIHQEPGTAERQWSPDSSGTCPNQSITQYSSNCEPSAKRTATGTKNETWSPAPAVVCAGGAMTQTSDCGNTKTVSGYCAGNQVCYNNSCCTPANPNANCGVDNCGVYRGECTGCRTKILGICVTNRSCNGNNMCE